jgi:hypothetical protein
MTDWNLLAIQFVGVGILTYLFCRSSYKHGYQSGYDAGYSVGKLDGRQ